jgi:cleavage stimulation factor subunit 3
MARQAGTGSTGSNSGGNVARADTMGTILSANQLGSSHKRPQSPGDYKRRDDRSSGADYGSSHKRQRPLSPPPVRERERDRERDRWDGPPPSRRRYASPLPWERERERDLAPPRRERLPPSEKDDDKPPLSALPPILSWFVGMLPSPNSFDGLSALPMFSKPLFNNVLL